MKANHNLFQAIDEVSGVVSESQRYKFWKQITTGDDTTDDTTELYQKAKDINFESKSQLSISDSNSASVVSESQRYKFWKQITTRATRSKGLIWLYQKAKDINFESKSQH